MRIRPYLEIASYFAAVVGTLWAIWTYFVPLKTAPLVDNTKAAQASGSNVTNTSQPLGMSTIPSEIVQGQGKEKTTGISSRDNTNEVPPVDLLEKLAFPGRALRYAEQFLGIPFEESKTHRVYQKYGYRFRICGISSDEKYYDIIEIGPIADVKTIPPLNLSGPWGKIANPFGIATFEEIDNSNVCRVSDFNNGAQSACRNLLEIECGGSRANSGLYMLAGFYYGCDYFDTGEEGIHQLLGDPFLSKEVVRNIERSVEQWGTPIKKSKINYLIISPTPRTASRFAGETCF